MYARIVRFTDVTGERVDQLIARIQESDGPPPGVKSTGIRLCHDEAQGTAVAIQLYETAEDMAAADEVFNAMEPSETPGTRTSVDRCETKLRKDMS